MPDEPEAEEKQARVRSAGRIPLQLRRNLRLARSCLSKDFEGPITEREAWWRCGLKETPSPGFYESIDFIDEIGKRPNTYRFKGDGRRLESQPYIGRGKLLLPGAYNRKSFTDDLDRTASSYSFKSTNRANRDYSNFGRKDKDVNVAPNAYCAEKYLCVEGLPQESKSVSLHYMFKSESKRFPTVGLKPRPGPAPCSYNNLPPPRCTTAVSSSFRSRTPRFKNANTRNPGPGQYMPSQQRSLVAGSTLGPGPPQRRPRAQSANPRHLSARAV